MCKRIVLAVLLCSASALSEEKWVRLSTPGFEIFTDAGAATAREVGRRFEEIRRVLMTDTPAQGWSQLPVRIFVFAGESEFAAYKDARRNSLAGFYRSQSDRDYIVMKNTGADLYRVVFHEYVHLFLHRSAVQLPLWFNEGAAELFSTAEITNSSINLGAIIPQHIRTLREAAIMDLPTLMQVDEKSDAYNEDNKAGMFYAESWALVHMLNMSARYAPGLSQFLELIRAGTPQLTALEQAFGRSTLQVFRDLQDYINGRQFITRVISAGPFEAIERVEPRPLSSLDSEFALIDLLVNLGRGRDAERRLKRLAHNDPRSSRVEAALGDTALAAQRHSDALAHYDRAIRLGGNTARIYFERAALVRELKGDSGQVIADLQKAIAIDPGYSQARDLLASVQFRNRPPESSPPPVHSHSMAEIPKGWQNRAGDHHIEGKLVQVDCMGKAALLHVITAAQTIALQVNDPSKVVLTNAPGTTTEFACGTVSPRDVAIEYVARPDNGLKSAGEITSIRFK